MTGSRWSPEAAAKRRCRRRRCTSRSTWRCRRRRRSARTGRPPCRWTRHSWRGPARVLRVSMTPGTARRSYMRRTHGGEESSHPRRAVSFWVSSSLRRASSSDLVNCSPSPSRTHPIESASPVRARLRNVSAAIVPCSTMPAVVNGPGCVDRDGAVACRSRHCGSRSTNGGPRRSGERSSRSAAHLAGGRSGRVPPRRTDCRDAAASTEYSWVNVAPSNRRRSAESFVPGTSRLAMRSAW